MPTEATCSPAKNQTNIPTKSGKTTSCAATSLSIPHTFRKLPATAGDKVRPALHQSAIDTVLYAQIFEAFKPENRGKYAYSDSNLWILKQIVERVSGETLDRMTRDLFAEMGCKNTYYNPLRYRSKERCMPTEVDHILKRRHGQRICT